jgi:hypothetical protein
MANVSKYERLRRPPKPEFALTGILIGAFAGEALAVTVEVAISQPNRWIMLAGGIAGIALGSLFETARLWRRMRKWRESRKP